MKVVACINDACLEVDLRVDPLREGVFIAEIGGREVYLELTERKPGSLTLAIDNQMGFSEFHSEKGRIDKEIAKCKKEIDGLEKKLGNEAFLSRAPEEVVAEIRQRLKDEQARLALLVDALEILGVVKQ